MIKDIVVLYCCFKETVAQVMVHYCKGVCMTFSQEEAYVLFGITL